MRTIQIPGLERSASRICLGTGIYGSAIPRDQAFALLDAFAASGGTFIDTAHIYAAWLPGGTGASEHTIGAWLASRGVTHEMVLATKGGHPDLGSSAPARLRPEHIASDLRDSLERLAVPGVDLYWLHRDDPAIPVGEILAVLEEHRRGGRIRAYGASNWTVGRIEEAQACARTRSWAGFAASQIGWSLADPHPPRIPPIGMRFMDAHTLAWHRRSGLRVIPYSSQAQGYFQKATPPALYDTVENQARRRRVHILAKHRGISANAVAVAWLLAHPVAGCAIVGPRTIDQLTDSLRAEAVTLTTDECAILSGEPRVLPRIQP